MERFKSAEDFFSAKPDQADLLTPLRNILLSLPLEETVKWGTPTYVYKKKNVVGIGAFKSYVGLWFFQGALLTDHQKVLVNAQEGVTQAMRQMRFSDASEIDPELIKAYVLESLENVDAGKEIKPKKKPLVIPEVLQNAMEKNEQLKAAFQEFSLGKQREFADHIGSAKREATQLSRLEKAIPLILNGIGLHDKYR